MPPNQKYTIYGKVYDGASNLLSGVTVNLTNAANGEQLPIDNQGTTDDNGEFSINAESLETSITDGQEYEVILTKNNFEELRIQGTFVIAGPGDEFIVDLMREGTKTHKFVNDYEFAQKKVTFKVWANNKTSTAAAAVIKTGGSGIGKGVNKKLTFPGIDLYPGQVAYIEQLTFMVRTTGKVCSFDIAKCANINGGGSTVVLSPSYHYVNGTITKAKQVTIKFAKPIRIEYNSTLAKSIGIRSVGDTSTYIDVSMEGYILEE